MFVPLMVFANTKKLTVAMHCCCPLQLGNVCDPLLFLHLGLWGPQPQRKLPIPSESSPQRHFGPQLHAILFISILHWRKLFWICLSISMHGDQAVPSQGGNPRASITACFSLGCVAAMSISIQVLNISAATKNTCCRCAMLGPSSLSSSSTCVEWTAQHASASNLSS